MISCLSDQIYRPVRTNILATKQKRFLLQTIGKNVFSGSKYPGQSLFGSVAIETGEKTKAYPVGVNFAFQVQQIS